VEAGFTRNADNSIPTAMPDEVSALQQLPDIEDLVKRYLDFRASLTSEEYCAMSATGEWV
jgi:hypothetical protein